MLEVGELLNKAAHKVVALRVNLSVYNIRISLIGEAA